MKILFIRIYYTLCYNGKSFKRELAQAFVKSAFVRGVMGDRTDMIFGKIDYINLLPFYIFLKKELRAPANKQALSYYKGVPSIITQDFIKRRVDSAIISSVASKRYRCTNLGVVANKEVLSVLCCGDSTKEDSESKTSNALAKYLGVEGEVVIGDKALKLYFEGKECKDLATLWYEQHQLPFVFARFCTHKKFAFCQKVSNKFLKRPVKIPYYILIRYAKRSGLSVAQIQLYLRKIEYKIDRKAQKSLKIFLKKI